MKEFTTKFYETSGGQIYAVVFEDGKPANITCDLADGQITGTEVLKAAREGWPYADQFEPSSWSGLSLEQAAEELEEGTHAPVGEECPVDLIAETKPTPAGIKGLPFVRLYWDRMGVAGLELFRDLDEPEAIAYRIKEAIEWNPDDCDKLIKAADMWDEYQALDADEFDIETFMTRVAEKLGVDIG